MKNEWQLHRIERIEQWLKLVSKDQYVRQLPLTLSCAKGQPFLSMEQATMLEYRPVGEGGEWGRSNEIVWFRIEGSVPPEWEFPASLLLNVDGELLLVDADGNPSYALSSGSIFDPLMVKDRYSLPASIESDFMIYGEAVANRLFGLYEPIGEHEPTRRTLVSENRTPEHIARVLEARLVAIDPKLDELYRQGAVLLDQIQSLPDGNMRKATLIRQLMKAVDAYERGERDACRERVFGCLQNPAYATELEYTAIGHAHIDTAWLWRLEESIRKCARTFSSQLEHIRRYPDYIFGASSPHHYAWMKQYYPALFNRIKEQIQAGRWECLGAMWVEADCNISGGEALARQLIYGKRYFQKEFGIDVNHLWLPDVFGYSACLPQLLQQVRAPCFMTTKISWNRYNQFPFASFHWQGIDGSSVLTHLPPTNNYNEQLIPSRLSAGRDAYPEKAIVPKALAVFGIGDGGGGPHESHIESGQLLKNLEAAPKVKFGTADGFFRELQDVAGELPTWNGELYLELHRGTLTTQAKIKSGNRRIEHRLRDTEILFAAFAMDRYPQAEIERLWKKFLVHQFHDILPGSCIAEVVRDTLREYDEVEASLDTLWGPWGANNGAGWTIVNSLNFQRDDVVRLPCTPGCCMEVQGKVLPSQIVGGETWVRVNQGGLSSVVCGESTTACAPPKKKKLLASDFPFVLENDSVLYRLNRHGEVEFAQDKATGRIFIENKNANELALYADHPTKWDAWDIDPFYSESLLETAQCSGDVEYEEGSVAQVLTFPLTIGNSQIVQRIILAAHRSVLEVENNVAWNEKHRMLRLNIPTTLQSVSAGYHIQFGLIHRSTTENTSEQQAQFEVAAHEFADLSEEDFGVALLNNCKYGYKVKGQTLSLSLLRSPDYPDLTADVGNQEFSYVIQPHAESLCRSRVVETAAAFNQPRWVLPGDAEFEFPFALTGEGVRLETVKKAEDSDDLIVRFYESKGRSTLAQLTLKNEYQIDEVNLLEEPQNDLGKQGRLNLPLRPFEIKTVRLRV